jgi:hypothetical protein
MVTDVSEEYMASLFRNEDYFKQETSKKLSVSETEAVIFTAVENLN